MMTNTFETGSLTEVRDGSPVSGNDNIFRAADYLTGQMYLNRNESTDRMLPDLEINQNDLIPGLQKSKLTGKFDAGKVEYKDSGSFESDGNSPENKKKAEDNKAGESRGSDSNTSESGESCGFEANAEQNRARAGERDHVPDALEARLGQMLEEGELKIGSPEERLLIRSLQQAFERGGLDGVKELVNGINKWLRDTGRKLHVTGIQRFQPKDKSQEGYKAGFILADENNKPLSAPIGLYLQRDSSI